MNLNDKIILAPRGYFNAKSEKAYRENSKEVCQASSSKDYISIIELDLRKSKDGILYCYHGNYFEYYISLNFSRNFSTIRKKYKVDTLAEIIDIIKQDKIVFLDIKERNITKEDILRAFSVKKFKQVILGNKSVSLLDRFDGMPREFVKIMNGNIFCNFYNLEKLKYKGFKYLEVVFPFQITRKFIEKVQSNGLEFRCSTLFFFNKESYWRKINKYNIKHTSTNFI